MKIEELFEKKKKRKKKKRNKSPFVYGIGVYPWYSYHHDQDSQNNYSSGANSAISSILIDSGGDAGGSES